LSIGGPKEKKSPPTEKVTKIQGIGLGEKKRVKNRHWGGGRGRQCRRPKAAEKKNGKEKRKTGKVKAEGILPQEKNWFLRKRGEAENPVPTATGERETKRKGRGEIQTAKRN